MASQDLLFEQLADSLRDECQGRFVRIRSAEAVNLKAVLKKIIRAATTRSAGEDEDQELAVGQDVSIRAILPEATANVDRAANTSTTISRLCMHSSN